nr:homeodomain-containing protein [Tanacetum cinerariifolium]
MKILENKLDSMKILKNKLESMKILHNKLESLKLQENQPVDGLVPLTIKKFTFESVFARQLKKNHREEEDQEGNNSLEIETLPLFHIHGGSQHDFFGVKALDLSSNHSVGGYYTARMVGPHMDITTDFMSTDVARGHGGDDRPPPYHVPTGCGGCLGNRDVARGHGGDDRPPPYHVPTGCGGCLGNRGKASHAKEDVASSKTTMPANIIILLPQQITKKMIKEKAIFNLCSSLSVEKPPAQTAREY